MNGKVVVIIVFVFTKDVWVSNAVVTGPYECTLVLKDGWNCFRAFADATSKENKNQDKKPLAHDYYRYPFSTDYDSSRWN